MLLLACRMFHRLFIPPIIRLERRDGNPGIRVIQKKSIAFKDDITRFGYSGYKKNSVVTEKVN